MSNYLWNKMIKHTCERSGNHLDSIALSWLKVNTIMCI
jgi:hypothetical protein